MLTVSEGCFTVQHLINHHPQTPPITLSTVLPATPSLHTLIRKGLRKNNFGMICEKVVRISILGF